MVRPDLSGFRVAAKIDYIKLLELSTGAFYRVAGAWACEKAILGQLELPQKSWESWATVHDPTVKDLQFLIDRFHRFEIELEIAVDLLPRNAPDQRHVY